MTDKKLLSIGFITYNGGARVRRALDSLLAQNYGNFELIISDNASSDETPTICGEYAEKDKRIRYIRQPENIGRINNFLFVLKEAKGDYFMWAADDDWWAEAFASSNIDGLEKNKHCNVALSSFERAYSDGTVIDEQSFIGDEATTGKSNYELYKKVALYSPIHIFFCGVWRIDFLRRLTSRPVPECRSWDRILMAEAALGGGFCSSEKNMFRKSKNQSPIKRRHKGDSEQARYSAKFTYLRYIFVFLGRMFSSPVVPPYRKCLIIWPWLLMIWKESKTIYGVTLRDFNQIVFGR